MALNGYGYGYGDGYGYGYGGGGGGGYGYGGYGDGDGLSLGLAYRVQVRTGDKVAIGCTEKTVNEWLCGDWSGLIKEHGLDAEQVATLRAYVEKLAEAMAND